MGEEIGVESYLKKIKSLLPQLGGIEITIDNDNVIQIVLNVHLDSYYPFIQSLFVKGHSPTFNELVG
jgi:hypothetical protein